MVSVVHAEQTVTAGISPDNQILWKIDIFFEHVNAFITYDYAKKIEKRMYSAEERAAEMEKMLRWKKTVEAEKAKIAFEEEQDALRSLIEQLDHKNPQTEMNQEFEVEVLLQNYNLELASIRSAMMAADIDDKQQELVQQFGEKIQTTDFLTVIATKKEATVLKLKANGLTDENIATLQADLMSKLQYVTQEVLETAENLSESEQPELIVESVVTQNVSKKQEPIVEQVTETNASVNQQEQMTIVTDTSSKSKVKVDGELTAEQLQAVNLLYSQLVAENTDAEIEITVTQMDNGFWKVEKEVDGMLTSLQQQQVDALLVSLSQTPSSVHIKVKYDPSEPEGAGVYVGGSSDVETTFVIG